MFNLSKYGHSFHGNLIYIFELDDNTAFSILESVRSMPCEYTFETEESLPEDIPDTVYFHSEESWYSLRFHKYSCDNGKASFMIHGIKPMYMATAQLLEYEGICKACGRKNGHTLLVMRKK